MKSQISSIQKPKLRDRALKKVILDSINLTDLEDVLHTEIGALGKLKSSEIQDSAEAQDGWNFEEVQHIFSEIKPKIDDFLGTANIESPGLFEADKFITPNRIRYGLGAIGFLGVFAGSTLINNPSPLVYSVGSMIGYATCMGIAVGKPWTHYDPFTKSIGISSDSSMSTIPSAIAHEYSHYVQHKTGVVSILPIGMSIFSEGHAMGVERYFAKLYAQNQDNQQLIVSSTGSTIDDLAGAYLWLCEETKKKPNKNIIRLLPEGAVSRNDSYALGNTLFYMAEMEFGAGIYANVLHNETGEQ